LSDLLCRRVAARSTGGSGRPSSSAHHPTSQATIVERSPLHLLAFLRRWGSAVYVTGSRQGYVFAPVRPVLLEQR